MHINSITLSTTDINSSNFKEHSKYSSQNSNIPVTSNTGIVNQHINVAKRVPRLLHILVNGGTVGGHVEFHGNRAKASGTAVGIRQRRRLHPIDFIAEGFKPIDTASRSDDPAASSGKVEAEVGAEAGGSAGDQNDFSGVVVPRLQVV